MPPPKLTKTDYFNRALHSRLHKAVAAALVILAFVAFTRHLWSLVLLMAAAEALFLLIAPSHPAFRSACDKAWAREFADRRAAVLEKIAGKLSPAAKARHDNILRLNERILDALRLLPCAEQQEELWTPRLKMLQEWSLRLLVAIDSARLTIHDSDVIQKEIVALEEQLRALPEGSPAADAKKQKIHLASERLKRSAQAKERRESAIIQFEAIEGILEEILSRGTSAINQDEFAGRLELIGAQVFALEESTNDISLPLAGPAADTTAIMDQSEKISV